MAENDTAGPAFTLGCLLRTPAGPAAPGGQRPAGWRQLVWQLELATGILDRLDGGLSRPAARRALRGGLGFVACALALMLLSVPCGGSSPHRLLSVSCGSSLCPAVAPLWLLSAPAPLRVLRRRDFAGRSGSRRPPGCARPCRAAAAHNRAEVHPPTSYSRPPTAAISLRRAPACSCELTHVFRCGSGRSRPRRRASRPTAATPAESPCCSCKLLTRVRCRVMHRLGPQPGPAAAQLRRGLHRCQQLALETAVDDRRVAAAAAATAVTASEGGGGGAGGGGCEHRVDLSEVTVGDQIGSGSFGVVSRATEMRWRRVRQGVIISLVPHGSFGVVSVPRRGVGVSVLRGGRALLSAVRLVSLPSGRSSDFAETALWNDRQQTPSSS